MKILVQTSFITLFLFGLNRNVFSCIIPSAPVNTTNPKSLFICEGMSTKLSAKGIGNMGWYSAPIGGTYLGNDTNYVTPILSKTTTFYVQDSTCGASATRTAITVIVNIHAIADFTVEPICDGDTAQFINLSKNAETYRWKFGDGGTSTEKSPKHRYKLWKKSQPMNATLVAIVSSGCSDSIVKMVNINGYPISDFTFTSIGTEVNFKAKQPGNTIYKYVFGNFDSTLRPNNTFTFPKPGAYTVCLHVTNAAGCYSKTCKEILLTVGISPLVTLNALKIYPSPNNGNFTIEQCGTKEILKIEILDQMGQVVHKAEIDDYLNLINLNLPNGVYQIRIRNVEQSLNHRIVVGK